MNTLGNSMNDNFHNPESAPLKSIFLEKPSEFLMIRYPEYKKE